ncbi:hypothetical protein PaecuDRAFT_0824 [Paenibacillus curdlanolyticus YK9]|uniref:Uncharacterized protein n=1 Tax=Paenibacillus curdlanolyticus YK9 TaxID=717606 RepID=E0I5A2_9BACL|nr:hypothetical protein PaecuDRAFT_0824 [Paenibacillus curdlanolyticus YK9]
MFGILRKRKISLEEQVSTLRQLGFAFHIDDEQLIPSLLESHSSKDYESEPYFLLLLTINEEHCDEIWTFDMECVEDEDIYTYIVNQFCNLSNGRFSLSNVESFVDFEKEIASVSFEFRGAAYIWELDFEHDWLDPNLLRRLANLADAMGETKHYYYFSDGQQLTIVYCTHEAMYQLNRKMRLHFDLLTWKLQD